jgi:nitroimidazol reductase NimA-like FMN-containing flavoprotein (pyridoxamine 5'-phosphate oxidase superfamily)
MTDEAASPSELFQLDRATCLTLLTTQHVGRLVVAGDEPAVVPVNYLVVDGVITFRTAPGTRADEAEPGLVMFEVDMLDERTRSGWSVVVHGRLMSRSPDETPPPVDTWAPGDRDHWMTVTVDVVTGRLLRGAVDASSHRSGGYL